VQPLATPAARPAKSAACLAVTIRYFGADIIGQFGAVHLFEFIALLIELLRPFAGAANLDQ